MQKARCHELWICLNQLCVSSGFSGPSHQVLVDWIAASWASAAAKAALTTLKCATDDRPISEFLPIEERQKYQVKYIRMLEAKKDYEKSGGWFSE